MWSTSHSNHKIGSPTAREVKNTVLPHSRKQDHRPSPRTAQPPSGELPRTLPNEGSSEVSVSSGAHTWDRSHMPRWPGNPLRPFSSFSGSYRHELSFERQVKRHPPTTPTTPLMGPATGGGRARVHKTIWWAKYRPKERKNAPRGDPKVQLVCTALQRAEPKQASITGRRVGEPMPWFSELSLCQTNKMFFP